MQVQVVVADGHGARKLQRIGNDIAMADTHTLATTGGAAGIEHDGVVVFLRFMRFECDCRRLELIVSGQTQVGAARVHA